MNNIIQKAITVLNQGGIIVFPTDTAFGIGCRMDNNDAVKRLFAIRKRPYTKATPVLVDGPDMAKNYLIDIPAKVKEKLMNKYWPGALTIVLDCIENKVPELVRGSTKKLGVRMPDHKQCLSIIKQLGVPLLAPSANFHGAATPYRLADLDKQLVQSVDFVLDGECKLKSPSTVIDCTKKPWQILRQGAVDLGIRN